MTPLVTIGQIAQLRRFAGEEASGTETGRTWIDRVRPVAPELVRLYSAQPAVRERIERALALAVPLVRSPQKRVSDDVVRAVNAALAAIDKSASQELRAVTRAARSELKGAAGRTLRDVFGVPAGS